MRRKEFLKLSGLAGAAGLVPLSNVLAAPRKGMADPNVCTLIPSETTGPYPLDLHTNQTYFRQDIRENQVGVQLNLRLRIIGVQNCEPMPNVRVDLWHCNAFGYYSGYTTNGQNGSQNNQAARWLRGIQMTNSNGEVEFVTIFPGWYSGRVAHIHFQIFPSSMSQATSQLTWDTAAKNQIYTTIAPYSQYGADPSSVATDNVFRDGTAGQVATLTANAARGGYDSFLEVGVNGSGVTGLMEMEPETGGQFSLGQSFPNPHAGQVTVPFTLTEDSTVALHLFDLQGRRVASVSKGRLAAGRQSIALDFGELGLPVGSYVYQLEVSNRHGEYRQCKMMTGGR